MFEEVSPTDREQRNQQFDPFVTSVPVYNMSLKAWPGDFETHEEPYYQYLSQTSMPGQFVLIHGVNSYLGFDVLVTILQAGYHVCAAVDGQPVIDWIRGSDAVTPYLANLDLVITSDLIEDNSSDEALKGVVGVAHIASSLALPAGNHVQNDLEPGIHVTITMLKFVSNTSTPAATATDSISSASQQAYAQPSSAYDFPNYLTSILAPHFNILSTMETFVISKEELTSESRAAHRTDRPALETILGVRNTQSFVDSISLMLMTWRRYMLAHYM